MSGLLVESRRSWTFQLLSEVIERALQTDRVQEADRLMRRAAKEVDDRLGGGDQLESDQLSMIASFAVRLAGLQGETEWIAWALTLHRRQGTMLDEEVVECFEALQPEMLDQAKSVIRGFAEWFRATPPSAPAPSLARLHRVEKLVH